MKIQEWRLICRCWVSGPSTKDLICRYVNEAFTQLELAWRTLVYRYIWGVLADSGDYHCSSKPFINISCFAKLIWLSFIQRTLEFEFSKREEIWFSLLEKAFICLRYILNHILPGSSWCYSNIDTGIWFGWCNHMEHHKLFEGIEWGFCSSGLYCS